MSKGLYIHIPFCKRKCAYCDFYSVPEASEHTEAYVRAVVRNIKAYGGVFDTVYFGGGTPSLLESGQVYDILCAGDIERGAEITAECNPDSADVNKLKGFFKAGVNRISIGVQSFDDGELMTLGRLHSAAQARGALINAREAGFDNISADLMMGLPFQKTETVLRNIDELVNLGVTHISAYMLKLEEGTPLAENSRLTGNCPDDDMTADMYLGAVGRLSEKGFSQYEISNFAYSGRECRHNLKYWRCGEYLGVGAAAHSCISGKRFAVPGDIHGFINSPVQDIFITEENACTAEEKMMLALRLCEGFDLSEAGERAVCVRNAALPLERAGLIKIKGNRICLTPEGFLVSNAVICSLTDCL